MEKTVLPKEPDQVEEQPVHAPTTSLDSAGPKTDTNLPPPVQDSDDTPSQHEDKDLRVFPSSVNQLIPDQPVRVSTSATVVLDNTPDVQHRNRFVFTSNLMAYMIVLLPVTFAAYVSTVWSANGPRSNEESSGNASYITTLFALMFPFLFACLFRPLALGTPIEFHDESQQSISYQPMSPIPPRHATDSSLAEVQSATCQNCRTFFSTAKDLSPIEAPVEYTHSKTISEVRQNARKGCTVCGFLDQKLQPSSQSGELKFSVHELIHSTERSGYIIARDCDCISCVLTRAERSTPLHNGSSPPIAMRWKNHRGWIIKARKYGVSISVVQEGDADQCHPPGEVPLAVRRQDRGHSHQIREKNNSAVTRQLAREWHTKCRNHHPECRAPKSTGSRNWLPSRLLTNADITDGDRNVVRLVTGASLPPNTEYAALSHCWGKIRILRLLASTEAELRAGILISELPKTFRHAFQVIRWLGYEYIWIDSLCIVQDSADDWQKESHMMKEIYLNAGITIAAAHAQDSSEGLFVKRYPNTLSPTVECSWGNGTSPRRYCLIDNHLVDTEIERSSLGRRAWTVQERTLSPRLLVFGKSQMHYRCLGNDLSESFPVCHVPFQEAIHLQQVSAVAGGLCQRWKWESIVDAYSQSLLTKDSDKVIALAGIAGLFRQHLQDDYVVGLWRRNLAIELLWSMKPSNDARRPRPKPCIAPTWSWLSTNGRVSVLTSHDPSTVKEVLIEITDYNVDLVDSASPTGNVYPGATLQLRGKLKRASWVVERCFNPDHQYQITFDGLHQDPEHGPSFRPEMDEAGGLEITRLTIFLLPIAVFCHGEAASIIMGLILTPVSEEAEMYQRIGHFLINEKMGRRLLQQRASPSQERASEDVGERAEHPDQAKSLDHHTRQVRADTSPQQGAGGQGAGGQGAASDSVSLEVPAQDDGSRTVEELLGETLGKDREEWVDIEEKDIVLL